MKFRLSQWLDTSDENVEEFPVVYGIQANKGNGWLNVAENGEPLFFDTAEEASIKLDELKAAYAA